MMDDERIVRELAATGKWSPIMAEIGLRANFRCEYCGLAFFESPENYKQWHCDHIVPKSAEGTNELDNFAASCTACNYSFKNKWNPVLYAGQNATRAELIAATQRYIRERKQDTEQQLATERAIIGMKTTDQILLNLEQDIYRAEQLLDKGNDPGRVVNETIEQMIATAAESMNGIRAKARVACSNRLGDLEEAVFDSSAPHNDQTLENSILRDLIRLYDPHLERKGAVQALLAPLG